MRCPPAAAPAVPSRTERLSEDHASTCGPHPYHCHLCPPCPDCCCPTLLSACSHVDVPISPACTHQLTESRHTLRCRSRPHAAQRRVLVQARPRPRQASLTAAPSLKGAAAARGAHRGGQELDAPALVPAATCNGMQAAGGSCMCSADRRCAPGPAAAQPSPPPPPSEPRASSPSSSSSAQGSKVGSRSLPLLLLAGELRQPERARKRCRS